jgi:hypothetical protein
MGKTAMHVPRRQCVVTGIVSKQGPTYSELARALINAESTVMICLRTDPEFPEGVFDPKVDQPESEEDVLVPGRD